MAALSYLHMKKNRNINVLMPYSTRWSVLANGTLSYGANPSGRTDKVPPRTRPRRSRSALSIQLYTSGPDDKLYTILTRGPGAKKTSPCRPRPKKRLKNPYLYGKSMDELRNIEALAAAAALAKVSRPRGGAFDSRT